MKIKFTIKQFSIYLGLAFIIGIILSFGSLIINESEGTTGRHLYENDFFRSSDLIKIKDSSKCTNNKPKDCIKFNDFIIDLRKHYGWPMYSMYQQEILLEHTTITKYYIDLVRFFINTSVYFCISIFFIFITYFIRSRKEKL